MKKRKLKQYMREKGMTWQQMDLYHIFMALYNIKSCDACGKNTNCWKCFEKWANS